MVAIAVLLVLCSGFLHAVWNLFAKQSGNKSVFLWLIMLVSTVALLPYSVAELAGTPLPVRGYVFLAVSMAMQGGYALLLSATYRHGDMSQVYPIMRGTPTLLIPLLGMTLFDESLSLTGWVGLACLFAGFTVMSGWSLRRGASGMTLKPVLLAFGVGLFITGYVLADKINVGAISPVALLGISNLGFVLALTPAVLRSGEIKREWTNGWKIVLLGSLLSPLSYLLFLFAMRLAPVGYISPIREIGTVFGTLLGIVVLKEQQGIRRIASSAVIAAGIMLIGIGG
ncbi:ligand-binding protein SH3 [Paenibacillus sp. 32O-W]|uniref:DMT family transporter n=1 Tax=Paenibacillus sp. 32O-W TaxID=1695218 RepID=UPI000721E6E6|nr:DMT family transporter [Paenibacillus sp. 32O-W]ALS25505.1 ligand-binding protein SH3 [Paenibacillus sp. 32O-W]